MPPDDPRRPAALRDPLSRTGLPTAPGYAIVRELGRGGMGVVYEARAAPGGRRVALKMMRQPDPAALDRFKQEFRILQGLSHRNLVTLYDLISDGEQWFFTMDLVEGQPFPGVASATSWDGATVEQPSAADLPPSVSGPGVAAPVGPLRGVLRQLAEGIGALHERGLLHRDIKPSNVLVAADGRVVLLDFGLAADTVGEVVEQTQLGAGTLLYMAPEQASGKAEPASDWYSFGIMLHEALTGRHPFRGTGHELPWARRFESVAPPHLSQPAIPEDLSQLCAELLRAEPAERPNGADVLRRLASGAGQGPGDQGLDRSRSPAEAAPFLGREADLAQLTAAFDAVQQGRTVAVLVHGPSGVGKSALAQHFVEGLRGRASGVVVLAGRCYERESVPYKALDGLVDALGRYWRRLPPEQARALLPRDVGPLVRVFPVLLRVEAVAEAPRREAPDPHEARRKAFAALREVLSRIGDRWPLVLLLDDLQWGDVDSAHLLGELLRPPEPPRLLLLAGFRSEDRARSPFLTTLLGTEGGNARSTRSTAARGQRAALRAGAELEVCEVALRPLGPADARALAVRLLGAETPAVDAIVRESGGNPFLVFEMAQAVRAGATDVTLGRVIGARVEALAEGPRRLLEVIAVAGRPLRHSVAIRAAGLGEQGPKCLIELEAARLVRGGAGGRPEVEAYHDRIRAAVAARLATDECRPLLARYHRRLARALADAGRADPEVLAIHYHGAGRSRQAGAHYARAARQAARSLAFDRAAELYRRALELRPDAAALHVPLAAALANAGRGAESAKAYLAAVASAAPGQALELQRRAAEQLLRSGRIAEGLERLRGVLDQVGLSFPATPWRALLTLAWRRLQLWWRGTKFHERPAAATSLEAQARMDVCWTAASVLSLVDTIRGNAFMALHNLLALRSGDLKRVTMALATEATCQATAGGAAEGKARGLLEAAGALIGRIDRRERAYYVALVALMGGAVASLLGRWSEACRRTARAQRLLRERCTGVAWELGANYHFRFTALEQAGRWRRCARELPAVLHEAQEHGDRYTATNVLLHAAFLDLADDAPGRARQAAARALGQWPYEGFHLQHYHALYTEVHTDLYLGDAERGWQRLNEQWPALRRSQLLFVQHVRIMMHNLRGGCALAVGQLDGAERDVRRLEKERAPWATALARLLRAGLAARREQRGEAIGLCETAERELLGVDMRLVAAAARRRRGQLSGDAALVRDAEAVMAREGIRNPARIADVLAPGFPPGPLAG